MSRNFDLNKLINAILYFSSKESIGITKLNKLLYYSDFEYFRLYGKPIIGDEYIKFPNGPVPEKSYAIFNSNFRERLDSSLKDYIDVKVTNYLNFSEKTIVPKKAPNLDYFSISEVEILEKMSEKHKGKTARAISQQSHEEAPWLKTELFKNIDYKLALSDEDDSFVSADYVKYKEEKSEELDSIVS